MSKKVLIIEDEQKLAQLLEDYLVAASYEALQIHDGAYAIKLDKTEST